MRCKEPGCRCGGTYVIRTSHDTPPIPSRQHDWSAWWDGHEELGTATGPTELDAVEALVEKIWCIWDRDSQRQG